jgi:acetolactate synthase I/II/III large subunit
MAAGITKYAVCVQDPASIRYHLERALHEAVTGRPGPCWLDIPMDVQASSVDEQGMAGFTPAPRGCPDDLTDACAEVIDRLSAASRPVIMAGSGVRLAGSAAPFRELVERLGIPVTTAWTAHDLLPSDHPLLCGRPGTVGDRAGNFTVQNADLLLVLGSRLNIRQVSYNWVSFARHACLVQVDVDPAELAKPTVRPDVPVRADLGDFIPLMNRILQVRGSRPARHREWLAWCRERAKRYPVVLPRHRAPGGKANPYHFMEQLFEALADDDVVVCGNGSACVITFQAARLREGQRLFANSGCASMGYDLPAAIGAAVARPGRRVVCIAGDGSIQMNIQELQTLAHHRLPVKVFVLSNAGYLSIRSTQKAFFGAFIGEGPGSGVTFPDMLGVAGAYGIRGVRIQGQECGEGIADVLQGGGPCVGEVMLDEGQEFEPKLSSRTLPDGKIVSSPLEDLFPFLDREELGHNMLVPLLDHVRE